MEGCTCELTSCSQYSPGLIVDGEVLARQIFSPIHIDLTTGKVVPAAFADVKNGLSVNRIAHITKNDLVQLGINKAQSDGIKGKERDFLGVVEIDSLTVRQLCDDDKRLFCMIDTANDNDVSHADIIQNTESHSASKFKKWRKALYSAFSTKLISKEEYT